MARLGKELGPDHYEGAKFMNSLAIFLLIIKKLLKQSPQKKADIDLNIKVSKVSNANFGGGMLDIDAGLDPVDHHPFRRSE
jgi:hypothetical protein